MGKALAFKKIFDEHFIFCPCCSIGISVMLITTIDPIHYKTALMSVFQ